MPIRRIIGPPNDRMARRLFNALAMLDRGRQRSAEGAARLSAALAASLDREQQRLAARHGTRSAHAAMAQKRARDQLRRADAAGSRAQELSVPWWVVTGSNTMVHGRVVDDRLRGVSGLRVEATDVQGLRFGETITDGAGYFRLNLPANVGGERQTPMRIVVRVLQNQQELTRTHDDVEVEAGTIAYLELELPRPPDPVR